MITALVLAQRDLGALAVTLSALVSGVAQGLIGDAVVLVSEADPRIERVAEAVGATLVRVAAGEDPWRAGAAVGRRDWLLCLEAGDVPVEGWIAALDRFVSFDAGALRLARLSRRSPSRARDVFSWIEARAGLRAARPGHLVRKSLLAEPVFPERVRPVTLAARIVPRRGSL